MASHFELSVSHSPGEGLQFLRPLTLTAVSETPLLSQEEWSSSWSEKHALKFFQSHPRLNLFSAQQAVSKSALQPFQGLIPLNTHSAF